MTDLDWTKVHQSSVGQRPNDGVQSMENSDTQCCICQGGHVETDCPYQETRDNLRRLYREGLHNLAEMTANRLGLKLNVSERSLLERLNEPEEGREQTPADLPPVGPWDPDFLESRRASPDAIEERVTDHTSNPRTLLNDSDHNTIRHGSIFEYWTRRMSALNTLEVVEEQSDAHVQEPSEILGTTSDFEDQFQNMVSTYQSNTTAIAFPVDSQNVATVREAAASDGSRANRGFWALNVHKIVKILYLVPFLVAIVLLAATWHYRRL